MQTKLKEDFIDGLINHHGYDIQEAEKVWKEEEENYLSRIYNHISDEIIEILNNRHNDIRLNEDDLDKEDLEHERRNNEN